MYEEFKLNLRDLQYFIALADLRHFGRAAEACFVSQPTLSTQLKKLEEELGVALFERVPRNVLLTPAGELILVHARAALAQVKHMHDIAQHTKNPESASVKLGIFPTLGPYLLPHVVPNIRKRFPKLELLLVEEKTETLIQQLKNGQIDAAILAEPVNDDQFESLALFVEPFVLALPANHPLTKQRTLGLNELEKQHLLLLADGHCLREHALEVCSLSGATEKEGFRATSLETLRQMVAAGVGITLLPILAVQPPVPISPYIRLVPFKNPVPTRNISLYWRKSSMRNTFLHELGLQIAKLPKGLFEMKFQSQ
jgi:LysR family hydrogen peroxide-inducible transcriptional activator